ncbi:MAG: glycosyltransferase, partial [bacterium]|nr:glycosyltransferase [bacterium]
HSPLRFLAPLIWGSFDFSKYDVVISSASWYITKGFGTRETNKKKPIEICYIHTPPRWLYGYDAPLDLNKNILVKIYVSFIAHFIRMYDFKAAQRVNYFVANSKNVAARIEKFYRRDSVVIYPPVEVNSKSEYRNSKREYYLIVSRITGGKGIELAVAAANKLGVKLKIAGSPSGYSSTYDWVKKNGGPTVELLGFVPDSEVGELYAGAKAFLALERDVDFGMTPVEAQAQGTPVIAYNGGGYPESVIDGKTGVLFDKYSTDGLIEAIKKFEKTKVDPEDCIKQAKKFSKEIFQKKMLEFIQEKAGDN